MKKITIVIDMQNDFLTGALANPDAVNVIPSVLEEIKKADFVIYTRDMHADNYLETQEGKKLPVPHCVEGTWGWQIVDELDPSAISNIAKSGNWHIADKTSFGSVNIWNGQILSELVIDYGQENIEATLCGTCTDICVVSNAMIIKALYPEMIVNVRADACAGLTPEKHKAALDVMSSCQINII